jgi:hypothetical protein
MSGLKFIKNNRPKLALMCRAAQLIANAGNCCRPVPTSIGAEGYWIGYRQIQDLLNYNPYYYRN